MVLAATMVVSGLFFAPAYAEESGKTEGDDIEYTDIVTEHIAKEYEEVIDIYSMDDLVMALGDSNVSRISDTEVELINDIEFLGTRIVVLAFYMTKVTVDFNGFVCDGAVAFRVFEGHLTVTDSSGRNAGGICASVLEYDGMEYYCRPLAVRGGQLTIESGRYTGYFASVIGYTGNLLIQGGVFEKYGDEDIPICAVLIYEEMSSAKITGGEFNGGLFGVLFTRESGDGVDADNPIPLEISGGTFTTTVELYGAVGFENRVSASYPDVGDLLAEYYGYLPSDTYQDNAGDTYYSYTSRNVVVRMIGVEGFVYRLYSKALDREPDPVGLVNWVNLLKSKTISGAEAAYGFLCSAELTNRNLSDEAFVTLLYNVLLNRAPDPVGMEAWLSALETGASRKYVIAGLANSQEWKGLCAEYQIEPGSFSSDEPRDQNLMVTAFVQRLYTLCLNRSADVPGLNYWTSELVKKSQDCAHVAYGFFFSKEFFAKNLTNADYVEVLYQVLLGRGSDPVGRAAWVAQLDDGKSRLEVFNGFVNSEEFDAICVEYGLVRGEI